MKRIEAFLKKSLGSIRLINRSKRIESVLNTAQINAEEQKSEAEFRLSELGEKLADTSNVQDVIDKMCDQFNTIEDAEAQLDRIAQIRKYLNEEVEE